MTARVLTISASYGAGGTVIAPQLAARLGLPFADRLIGPGQISVTSSGESLTEAEAAQQPRSSLLEGLALLGPAWSLPVVRDLEDSPEQVREQVEASLRDILASGGAVILGRAAAAALGRTPGAFHVRLDGPEDRRARRGAAWEQIDLDTARRHLQDTDSVRDRYVRRLYRRDPTDPTLYHLLVDATVLSADATVELLVGAAEAFWAHDDNRLQEATEEARARLSRKRR